MVLRGAQGVPHGVVEEGGVGRLGHAVLVLDPRRRIPICRVMFPVPYIDCRIVTKLSVLDLVPIVSGEPLGARTAHRWPADKRVASPRALPARPASVAINSTPAPIRPGQERMNAHQASQRQRSPGCGQQPPCCARCLADFWVGASEPVNRRSHGFLAKFGERRAYNGSSLVGTGLLRARIFAGWVLVIFTARIRRSG